LRPIEEFRHTPIIPLSEKEMAEHRKKIDDKNRKGYYVEIKKDTIYFYSKSTTLLITPSFSDCHASSWCDRLCLYNDEWEVDVNKVKSR
jgi:hypothetical protein